MKNESIAARTPSKKPNEGHVSQVLFVLIGLGIITGGLWTLYMADAPYHPVSEDEIFLAAD